MFESETARLVVVSGLLVQDVPGISQVFLRETLAAAPTGSLIEAVEGDSGARE